MKDPEEFLARVFSAARSEPPHSLPAEPPFGMETAIIAHWRSAILSRKGNSGLVRGLRWSALIACTIALSAAAFSHDELAEMSHLFAAETHIGESALLAGYGND